LAERRAFFAFCCFRKARRNDIDIDDCLRAHVNAKNQRLKSEYEKRFGDLLKEKVLIDEEAARNAPRSTRSTRCSNFRRSLQQVITKYEKKTSQQRRRCSALCFPNQ